MPASSGSHRPSNAVLSRPLVLSFTSRSRRLSGRPAGVWMSWCLSFALPGGVGSKTLGLEEKRTSGGDYDVHFKGGT